MHHINAQSKSGLNAGWGRVTPEVQVDLDLPVGLAMAGGSLDFFSGLFNAVHRVNRHAPDGGYIAIALPDLQPGVRGLQALGRSIRLVGAHAAIARLEDDTRVPREAKRALRYGLDAGPDFRAPSVGRALVRTRQDDNWAPGRVRNRLARLDRQIAAADDPERRMRLSATRARIVENADARWRNRDDADAFMTFGQVPVGMRLVDAAPAPDGRVLASTWGLSHPDAPLVFEASHPQPAPRTGRKRNVRFAGSTADALDFA